MIMLPKSNDPVISCSINVLFLLTAVFLVRSVLAVYPPVALSVIGNASRLVIAFKFGAI
jgi:hypothetical protein